MRKQDSFTLNYVNFRYGSGQVLEKHWGRHSFRWGYGENQLVDGLELGMAGMRVGGRRELIVPSRLAYDAGPLVYLLELLEAGPAR